MTDDRIALGDAEYPLPFLLISAGDHRTGVTGASPTVLISKDGGAFAAPAGAVSEVGHGWYRVLPSNADTDTRGPLLIHAEATGADPWDDRYDVVPSRAVPPVKQGQKSYPLTFLMVDSADHLTGKTGLSPTVLISKAGTSFLPPVGAVAEIGHGWYKVASDLTDTNTPGPLLLHAEAAGADVTDERYGVSAVGIAAGMTTAADVLGGVKQALVDSGLFTDRTCWLGLDPDAFPKAGGPFCVIEPEGQEILAPQVTGAGRYLTGLAAKFTLHVIDRMVRDAAYEDTLRLTLGGSAGSPRGLYRTVADAVNAVQLIFLEDGSGNSIVQEPIRLRGGIGRPRWYGPEKGKAREWVGVAVEMEAKYTADLDVID